MSSTEAPSSLPNLKEFPSYIPVHPSVKPNTEFGSLLLLREIDDQLLNIKSSAESFIEYASSNPQLVHNASFKTYSDQVLGAFEKLYLSKCKLQALQQALKDTHRELVENRRSTLELTLSSYDSCKELVKKNFADGFSDDLDQLVEEMLGAHAEELLNRDPSFVFIKSMFFVLQFPEDPLQDDTVDEELAMEGGKISLKDPLSMNYFTDPMVSKKCSHVFERQYITRQIRAARERYACPVTGCEAYLTEGDLSTDKLMKLRVKVYMGMEKKRDHESVVRI